MVLYYFVNRCWNLKKNTVQSNLINIFLYGNFYDTQYNAGCMIRDEMAVGDRMWESLQRSFEF